MELLWRDHCRLVRIHELSPEDMAARVALAHHDVAECAALRAALLARWIDVAHR